MIRKALFWERFKNLAIAAAWIDRLWWLGLLVAAGLLFGVNLGGVPLRDWDEGTVAQVAREIWRSPPGALTWLHPTIAGEPYLNKPPLMHWLMAGAFRWGGVNEWTARLPGASLTALSVPLLYGVGRELFVRRTPAIFAALVYLTLLPVVRHGRLAMLDGAVLCFFLLLIFCVLRMRRNLRWGLGVGLAFGLLCLTKGVVALLIGAIALAFVLWDTPRLLTSAYVWVGLFLGSAPVVTWYSAQWQHYGQQFVNTGLLSQSFDRLVLPVEGNRGAPWYYLLELLKFSLPWLLFFPQGLRSTWENRNLGWAKLVLVWVIGYLGVISLMRTKLPWYVLPVYPALAIAAGVCLTELWQPSNLFGLVQLPRRRYPVVSMVLLSLVAIVGWAGSFYFSSMGSQPEPGLPLVLVAIALTLTVTVLLMWQRDAQFILVLLWGMYVSLLLFMASPYWVWELDEAYPVKPVAALLQQQTPPTQLIWTSYKIYRPSLNFYSDRRVIPASNDTSQINAALKAHWQEQPQPYLLVAPATLTQLALPSVHLLGKAEGWLLVTRQDKTESR